MAWVEKVNRKKGHAWRMGYRGPNRRQRYKTFTRKADADLFAATVETDLARGDWTDPRLGKITVAEWARQVEASRLNRRRSTTARDDSYLRSFVLPAFGDSRLIDVQPVAVQQWVAELNEEAYAPATIRKAYQILGRIFTAAVESRLIPRSPCQGVKLPKIEQTEKRFLSPAEIQKLADTIHPRFQALVLTTAYSGARFGELAGLGRRDPTGRKRTKNFAKKSDAEKYAAIVEDDKLRGDWTDPQLGRTSLSSWWDLGQAPETVGHPRKKEDSASGIH